MILFIFIGIVKSPDGVIPQELNAVVGTSFEWKCSLGVLVEWYDNISFKKPRNSVFLANTSSLKIEKVQLSQGGTYYCINVGYSTDEYAIATGLLILYGNSNGLTLPSFG